MRLSAKWFMLIGFLACCGLFIPVCSPSPTQSLFMAPQRLISNQMYSKLWSSLSTIVGLKPILMRKNLEYVSAKNECEMHFNTDLLT